jgi:RNA polymerase sigma-70 factor, ECF subfamily
MGLIGHMNTADEEQRLILELREPARRQEAFYRMVVQHQERLYWHIRRLLVVHEDAEDVLQETFIKAFRSIEQFEGKSRLYTWLCRISTNECLRFLKKRKWGWLSMESPGADLVKKLHETPLADASALEIQLQEALLQLPEKQRLVFNLRYYDDLSYEEIREITGSSVSSLKTNYHYAFQKIKDLLLQL